MAGWVVLSAVLLLNAVAGSRMEEMKSSIIGGHDAKEGAWPWMAYVHIVTSHGEYRCGGTIINNRWILTAAHCVAYKDLIVTRCFVRLGAYKLEQPSPNEVKYTTARVIIHPQYYSDSRAIFNDVALLNLDKIITFTRYITPVILAQSSDSFGPQSYCVAIGWGMTGCNNFLSSPMTLQELNIPLGLQDSCGNPRGFICGGEFRKLVYKGDSGGPLMCNVGNNWVQAGISSYVRDCDWKILPAYFTSVATYRNFIDQYTRTSTQEY